MSSPPETIVAEEHTGGASTEVVEVAAADVGEEAGTELTPQRSQQRSHTASPRTPREGVTRAEHLESARQEHSGRIGERRRIQLHLGQALHHLHVLQKISGDAAYAAVDPAQFVAELKLRDDSLFSPIPKVFTPRRKAVESIVSGPVTARTVCRNDDYTPPARAKPTMLPSDLNNKALPLRRTITAMRRHNARAHPVSESRYAGLFSKNADVNPNVAQAALPAEYCPTSLAQTPRGLIAARKKAELERQMRPATRPGTAPPQGHRASSSRAAPPLAAVAPRVTKKVSSDFVPRCALVAKK